MLSPRVFLPFLALSLILIVVALFAAKNMYVAALTIEPKQAMARWSCNGKIDDLVNWEVQKTKLEKANKLFSLDADIVSDLGRMHEFRALDYAVWKPEAKSNRETAISYYRDATQYRPTWAMAWLNLAQAKIMNQQSDDEAFDAIRAGFRFGSWQEKVQQRLLWLSVGIWPVLPDDIKMKVRNIVIKTLNQNYRVEMLVAMALRFNWIAELESLVTNSEHLLIINQYRDNKELQDRMLKQQSTNLVC